MLELEDQDGPNNDRYEGVRILLMKVIVRAMFDLASYRDHPNPEKRKEAESARKWLFEPSDYENSFTNVCSMLGLNPRKIRERASTMTKADVAKIEFKDRRPISEKRPQSEVTDDEEYDPEEAD